MNVRCTHTARLSSLRGLEAACYLALEYGLEIQGTLEMEPGLNECYGSAQVLEELRTEFDEGAALFYAPTQTEFGHKWLVVTGATWGQIPALYDSGLDFQAELSPEWYREQYLQSRWFDGSEFSVDDFAQYHAYVCRVASGELHVEK